MRPGEELTEWERAVQLWDPVLDAEPEAGLVESWRAGQAPFVRVWGVDVVRISEVIASETRALLSEWEIPQGPVLINLPRSCEEVFVPAGSSVRWRPVSKTVCVQGALLRAPAPDVTRLSGRWVEGRTWARPPGTSPETTDAEALADALHTVLAQQFAALRGDEGRRS